MTGFLAEDPENEYGDFYVVAAMFFGAGVTRETTGLASARRKKISVRGTIDRRIPDHRRFATGPYGGPRF